MGIVDYRGSRLLALERCWPTAASVSAVVDRSVVEYGAPVRLLSDNGVQFRSAHFSETLTKHGIAHTFTKPAHPWTNGRIERIFRTFKETMNDVRWLFGSVAQIDRYAADFLIYYNRDRPHARFDGRTPDEVFFDREERGRYRGRQSYFDDRLLWYRFG